MIDVLTQGQRKGPDSTQISFTSEIGARYSGGVMSKKWISLLAQALPPTPPPNHPDTVPWRVVGRGSGLVVRVKSWINPMRPSRQGENEGGNALSSARLGGGGCAKTQPSSLRKQGSIPPVLKTQILGLWTPAGVYARAGQRPDTGAGVTMAGHVAGTLLAIILLPLIPAAPWREPGSPLDHAVRSRISTAYGRLSGMIGLVGSCE